MHPFRAQSVLVLPFQPSQASLPSDIPELAFFFPFFFSPQSRAQLFTQRKQGSDKVTEYTCCENMQAEAEGKKTFFHK